jgi:transcriptional regulator with XRE-family HTH domain
MPKKTIQQIVGTFIATERKKQKLSLAKLSNLAFGHTHYANKIMDIEKGKIKEFSVDTLDKILSGLGFNMAEMFKP